MLYTKMTSYIKNLIYKLLKISIAKKRKLAGEISKGNLEILYCFITIYYQRTMLYIVKSTKRLSVF